MFFSLLPQQNTSIIDAICEWSLEEILTVLPEFHGYVKPQTPQKHLVEELSDTVSLEQLDKFKAHLKAALEKLFNENDNIWYRHKIRLNDQMLIAAAIEANFPEFLMPPSNIHMTSPAINFSIDDDKKSITWEGGQIYDRNRMIIGFVVNDSKAIYSSKTLSQLCVAIESKSSLRAGAI